MWRNAMSYKRITDLDRLGLLLWKNYLLVIRTRSKILTLIVVPLIFVLVFVAVKFLRPDHPMDYKSYAGMDITTSPSYANHSHLVFIANNFKEAPKIMKEIEILLKLNSSVELFSDAELEQYLQKQSVVAIGGIVFQNKTGLKATIRVAGVKTQKRSDDHWWNTDLLYPWLVEIDPRFYNDKDGGRVPGYLQTGFMAIQGALSIAYLKEMGKLEKLPKIQLKRFPHPGYIRKDSLLINKIILNVCTVIGFYFICLYNVKSIVLEKEMQFKEAMKMMGLGDFLHWCAWFIEFVVLFFGIALVMICSWKFSKVFEYSHVGLLMLVYFTYAFAFATFCFLLSSIFSKSATATIFVLLIWFVTIVPYFITYRGSRLCKYFAGLSLNTAMFYFIDILYNREALQEGIRPWNYFDPVWFEHNISAADCVHMLIIDFVVYAIVAWYLNKVFPGPYGIPAKWYFPFAGLCTFSADIRPVYGTFEMGTNFERGPEGKVPAIKIIGLTKIYSNATVGLDNVNLNVYNNEITILLGENGAGKSTLLSVLTGLYPPTNGTAIINEFDIRTHMDLIHESLGVCPQHNILFNLLTVEEHLIFFSKLKGCRTPEANYEAAKYLNQLDLKEKADNTVETIPMGMKRRLSLAIALCGDSKVILADEPTAGMDPVARKAVWDLLQVEKTTRIIILSTHIMEEADVLADRVAILQGGKLKCYGTPNFLMGLYGGAKFKLTCEKNEGSDVEGIKSLVNLHVPTATVSLDMASELSFKLDAAYKIKFVTLLGEIETNANKLGLQGYGISLTGLEEVFFRVLLDSPDIALPVDSQRALNPTDGLQHRTLCQSQVMGLLLKKYFYTKAHWAAAIMQLIIPPLLIYIMLRTVSDPSQRYRQEPPLEIKIESYLNDPICVMTPPTSQLAREYAAIFTEPSVNRLLEVEENISEYFLNKKKLSDVPVLHMKYLIGASFDKEPLVAWYNNQPYHAIPLAIDVLINAMLRVTCQNCSLSIVNHPLPELRGVRHDMANAKVQDVIGDVMLVVIFDLGMFIMVAYFVIDCVKEQRTKVKLLQFISGISPFNYWLVTMSSDFALAMVTVGMVVGVYMMEVEAISACSNLVIVLMAYVVSVLPFVYLRSLRFANPTAAYLNILMLGILFGTMLRFAWSDGAPYIPVDAYWKNITQIVLQTIPFFNLARGTEHVWMDHDSLRNDWHLMSGYQISRSVIIFCSCGAFFFVLLMLHECKVWWWMVYAVSGRRVGTTNDASMDVDVIKERDYVDTMGATNITLLNLVCQKLCKSYDSILAVNDLSFTIEGSQCFGIMGANGAGKTTLFKLLTGDEKVSSGDAWVRGLSLKKDLRSIYTEIGYCPQEEALPEDLTGRQTLKVFCLLKGISTEIVDQVSLEIAHNLGLLAHVDKKVKEMSGGNRRKLTVALAMLNEPRLLLMDEPTSGLDPSAKRQMWKMISSHKDFGKSILLSSQSMEECEVLCTRLAILVNGQLRCIGTTQHLRARFAEGYLLVVQMNRASTNLMEPGSDLRIHRVEEYIYNAFPGAVLQEKYQGRLYYHIPWMRGMRWSVMFAKLESIRGTMEIESYNLKQLGLDHVFRSFTQAQMQDVREST